MVLREGMGAVVCGIALGAIIGLACARVISSQLYGVQAADVATLAGATVVIGAVAFLACYFPARNAATIDPLVALRNN
jgi:putative ABC transport system permease protein